MSHQKLFVAAGCMLLTLGSMASSSCETINECIDKASERKLSYLPSYLKDKKKLCESYRHHYTQAQMDDCLGESITEAQLILSCETDSARRKEMAAYDDSLFTNMKQDHGVASIPLEIEVLFKRLTQAAAEISEESKTFDWKLSSYNAPFFNAHAGAGANIMVSAALWAKGSAFTAEDAASFLAHEVAHEMKHHSLKMGCLSLEWVGPLLTIPDAMETFRQDFSPSYERGIAWSKISNGIEYEADAIATEILLKAGMDPMDMPRALEKLRPKNAGGFSSGSHPEFDDRIKAATERAQETLKKYR